MAFCFGCGGGGDGEASLLPCLLFEENAVLMREAKCENLLCDRECEEDDDDVAAAAAAAGAGAGAAAAAA